MDTLLTGIVDWKERKVFVNGKFMEVDALGAFSINVSAILAVEEQMPGLERFLLRLEEVWTFEKIKTIYLILGRSKSITVTDMANALHIEKSIARKVLDCGLLCGILCKGYNSTWKVVDKLTRERIAKEHNEMQETHKPRKTVDDVFKDEMARMKKEDAISEENTEKMIENDGEERAVIAVGLKGSGTRSQNSVILPKKKPLPISAHPIKKSRKPAKT